jgi:hypothetical protein
LSVRLFAQFFFLNQASLDLNPSLGECEQPAQSALVFGRPEGGYENDRYVTARELATFDMPADLVVVSSCNSGNGRAAAGEGILGLPYALFAAGATSALVTRWSIYDDDANAHLVGQHTMYMVYLGMRLTRTNNQTLSRLL